MEAQYYYDIYLLIITLLTFIIASQYNTRVLSNSNRSKISYSTFAWVIAVCCALIIGLRPLSKVFVDMMNYDSYYSTLFGTQFEFSRDVDNLIFDNWLAYMASSMIPVKFFFLSCATIYFISILLACKKLFPKDTLLAFIVYLAAFSTFSYSTNGIKAGVAASLFLVALANKDKIWFSVPMALLTLGFHHSMLLVVVAYISVLLVRNPKWYFFIWLASFFIAALHITYFQFLFAGFTDEHGAEYLLGDENSGFRIDFIIYSAIPVILGYVLLYRYRIKNETYNLLLSIYMLTNSVWMLCMYSNFTNRISYLSWFIYPIVLLYPFVNIVWSKYQGRYLKYVVYGHLFFTLFMNFVYYKFLHS